jgi:hypothetical protein
MTITWRAAAWVLFIAMALVRPGVDRLDRWLVGFCWNVPSEWNAVAEIALRTGAVDQDIDGKPAPWRQASVLPAGGRRLAVVTVSDLRLSRVSFISEQYEPIGAFERTTADPALVTDETRGYKPLSHIWPLVEQDNRLLTLISFAPLRSEPPTLGAFAYLAVGTRDTEVLFVCELRWAPGPSHAELARADVDHSGTGDLVLYPEGRRDAAPIATFRWDPSRREFATAAGKEAEMFGSWWTTTSANRLIVRQDESIDEAVANVLKGLSASSKQRVAP